MNDRGRFLTFVLIIFFLTVFLPESEATTTSRTNNGTSSCVACPAGRTGTGCSGCPIAGQCPHVGACAWCRPGTANSRAGGECETCATGYVSGTIGALTCLPCPRGYEASSDSTECLVCSAGTYNPDLAGQCIACEPGSYWGFPMGVRCLACKAGSYSSTPSATTCKPCGQGFYNPTTGSSNVSACLPCPSGTYCPDELNTLPKDCPVGSYCPAQARAAISCGTFKTSKSKASSCFFTDSFYVVISAGALLVVLIIVVAAICFIKHRRQHHQAQFEQDNRRLLPDSLPGPVYGGY